MPKFKDLTGLVFGRLTVKERTDDYVSPSGYRKTRWRCECQCGNIVDVNAAELTRGETKSCGCYEIESKRARATTHGYSKEPLYQTWKGIKARCFNKNNSSYERYGGRGITMCDEWATSYPSFREWAMTHGYDNNLTVDRIDNNGNYEPDNCRFVTRVVQANNRESNVQVSYDGETHNLRWWSNYTGIPYGNLYYRIKSGWDIKTALTI